MSTEFMERMLSTYGRVHTARYWDQIDTTLGSEFLKGATVADLGCGPGLLLRDLALKYQPDHLIGVDISPIMLERAKIENQDSDVKKTFIIQHLQDNPHLEFTADAIFSSRVLRSFEAQDVIMKAIHNSLSNGGYLVIVDWVRASIQEYHSWFSNKDNDFENLSPAEIIRFHRMFSRYHIDDWSYIVSHSGFEVVHSFQIDAVHACLIARKL